MCHIKLKETWYVDVDGIHLAPDRVKWLAVVKLVSER